MDLTEVLVGQIRRSPDIADVINKILSGRLNLVRQHKLCTDIVALAGRTIFPDWVRCYFHIDLLTCIQCRVHSFLTFPARAMALPRISTASLQNLELFGFIVMSACLLSTIWKKIRS